MPENFTKNYSKRGGPDPLPPPPPPPPPPQKKKNKKKTDLDSLSKFTY